LKVRQNSDGTKTEEYATTSFGVFSTRSKSDYGYDDSYGVKAFSTIYWEVETNHPDPSNTYIRLTRATGGWDILDNQLLIASKKVTLFTNGQTYGAFGNITQLDPHYPTLLDFDYDAPSSWYSVDNDTGLQDVGCLQECEVLRNSSVWEFKFKNSY